MCLMLYMATEGDLQVQNTAELRIEAVETSRATVYQWFSLPVVRFIGAHTGCSCGFPSVVAAEPIEYFNGMLDGTQDREADLKSVDSLLALVRDRVAATGEVQLYPVWDGEESSPPKGVISVGIDSLDRETFFLNERFLYRISRQMTRS